MERYYEHSTNPALESAWTPASHLPKLSRSFTLSVAFKVSFLDLVLKFSTTPERREILQGFLDFRTLLHDAGLSMGFQWVDGSFMENVELLHNRPPHDIDIVTFFELQAGVTEETIENRHPHLFDDEQIKWKFFIDSYFLFLGAGYADSWIIKNSVYRYSMWAHQRNSFTWKGFLQIDLDPIFEEESRQILLTENVKRS